MSPVGSKSFLERWIDLGCSILYKTVFNIIQLGIGKPMRGLGALMSRKNAGRVNRIQAAIGQALRKQYASTQPLPDRLADLVEKLEQSTSLSQSERT
jgi:Anti-sigma factor NepR